MANVTIPFDDAKLNALKYQMNKKGLDFNKEAQALLTPVLQKMYVKQVPEAVREFAEAMAGLQQNAQTLQNGKGRAGNGKAQSAKQIIGQEKMEPSR